MTNVDRSGLKLKKPKQGPSPLSDFRMQCSTVKLSSESYTRMKVLSGLGSRPNSG